MDNGERSYRRFLDGDENAFREVIEAYKDNLIFFICRYVHSVSAAEEIAQDVFVELIVHKKRYNFKISLKTYLFTIGRNKAVSYARKCSKHPELAYEFIENEADAKSLEEEFITKERYKALHEALDTLPEDYRTVLHLIYFENMSYDDAGKVMKKNNKQITNLVYRARKTLKEKLGKESDLFENK